MKNYPVLARGTMTVKLLLIFMSVTSYCNQLGAQETDPVIELMTGTSFKNSRVIPPSPEAASLGKFGNVPVSLFTGTPKMSIPFYELKGNTLSLPIQLSYNASGFNPQEVAGWTGLGWSLAAGGVITRSVIGNPDVAGAPPNSFANYFTTPSPLDVPNTADQIVYNQYLNDLKSGLKEAQPDMYYYNFGGYSGKFMIKPDGAVMMFEKNNFQVSYSINGTPGSGYFTITDPTGTVYHFNATEVSYTISSNNDNNTEVPIRTYTYESAWFLTSITSANGDEQISLQYHSLTPYHYPNGQAVANQAKVYTYTVNSGAMPAISYSYSGAPVNGISRRYLQKITLKRNGIDIAYADFNSVVDQRQDLGHSIMEFPGERMLTDIKVYSKATDLSFKLIKQYNFNYSYFGAQPPGDIWQNRRLRLDQIQEISIAATTSNPPPYTFEYKSGTVPHLGTGGIDHWGFANAETGYTTTPDSYATLNEVFVTGGNRAPSFASASACILQKIQYPTGGYTSFEYEQHFATTENAGAIAVGGIRLKKMIDYSAQNQKAVEKIYEYTLENGTTSGKAKYPSYKTVSNYTNYGPTPGGQWNGNCDISYSTVKRIVTVAATSVMGLGSVMGSHIGYSRVTEKQTDVVTGEALGKIVYEYEMGGSWGELQNEDVKNGELLKQSVYDNGDKLIQSTESVYATKPSNNSFSITGISAVAYAEQDNLKYMIKYTYNNTIYYGWYGATNCLPTQPPGAYQYITALECKTKGSVYGVTYMPDNRKLVQQTIKTYDKVTDAYLTSIKTIDYENPVHSLPTTIEQTTNNNEIVVTKKKYAQDYTVTITPPHIMPSDPFAMGIWALQNRNMIGAEIETYQYRKNNNGTNFRFIGGTINHFSYLNTYPEAVYALEITQPLNSFQPSNLNTSNVFSYDPAYKKVGEFKYAGSLITEQTKNNDITTSYVWNYNGNMPVAEVVNAASNAIAYTSFETDEGGNWSSTNGFAMNRASGGVTGNYSYNISSGNIISKSGLPSQKYILSYWSANGPLTVNPAATPQTGATVNGFIYYEHLLPVTTSVSVSVSGPKIIDELRLYPEKALMSTTTYNYYTGQINSQCSPANKIVRYEYDGLQRLLNVRDEAGNIVKNYKYNYGTVNTTTASPQTLFYSARAQSIFLKIGCPVDAEAQPYTYVVPYGKYVSVNSQAEANAKATAEINANGQATANLKGLCYFWNTEQRRRFFKNNCQPWEGNGMAYFYTVPARTYWSLVSVADANAKAIADINANGQNAANTYGSCSCTQQGYRMVNGVCEQGGINYVGYEVAPNCELGKNYRCFFVYTFSDGYQSPVYSICSASAPCQNQ